MFSIVFKKMLVSFFIFLASILIVTMLLISSMPEIFSEWSFWVPVLIIFLVLSIFNHAINSEGETA
jgi:hypothetical protein